MQKFLTPDLKYKLRQSIPFVTVTVITCLWSAWFHSYVYTEMKEVHEEVKEIHVRNRETNDRVDAMSSRVDHVWQILLTQALRDKVIQR